MLQHIWGLYEIFSSLLFSSLLFVMLSAGPLFAQNPACDSGADLWSCACPSMGNLGDCDIVRFSDFIDLGDASTVNTTDWVTTTYDASLGSYVVDLDLGETSRVFLPPDAEGCWSSSSEFHEYISDLFGVPRDASGHLLPFTVNQSGMAAMYFSDEDKLWQSSSFLALLAAASDGNVYFNNVPLSAQFGRTCPPLYWDAVNNEDTCEWQGGDCIRTISGTNNGATCDSTDQLVMWRSNLTNFVAGCAQHTIDNLKVNGGILIPAGTTLGQTQGTNPIACTQQPFGPVRCDVSSLAELVLPAGFSPGQSGYYSRLTVRWVRVLADMSIMSQYWDNGTPEGQLSHSAASTESLEVNWSGQGLPFSAACSQNLAADSTVGFSIPINNGLANDGSSNQPVCIP